jgi:tripartite-type tricarboxylate transporter receptor subunit TctC
LQQIAVNFLHRRKEKGMFNQAKPFAISCGVLATLAAMIALAAAQAPMLASKNVTMIIGSGTGGATDQWGRVVARHIGKHLPGRPTVVPQNMPGAGGITAVNHIYNIAPKDGTVFGSVVASVAVSPITGAAGARFDPLKLTWVGTPTTQTYVCLAMARAQVKTFQDLLANELIVGTSGVGSASYFQPKAINGLLGTKFKLVSGFPFLSNVLLALERNEVDGVCQPLDAVVTLRPDWIADKKVNVLFQGGARPNSELKGVPFIVDLARTPEEKQAVEFLYAGNNLGRPVVAPPDMPAERVNILRDAFGATMNDSEFLADAERQKLYVAPNDGENLSALIQKLYATPKAVVDKVSELIK